MKSQIKKLEKSQMEMEVEISAEEFDKFINQTLLNLAQNMEVEGFRKGKAPKEIVEKKIGEQKILMEAADLAVKENYLKAVEENKLEPISQPEISVMKLVRGNPFVFKAKFYVLPEIKLPDYKKIAGFVKKQELSVKDEEVEQTLDWVKKSRAKFSVKNPSINSGQAEKGDFVEIEYSISTLDNPVPSQKIKDAFILGEGHLLSDFENGLIGMKAGETKEISFDVPKNHRQKNVAGKKVIIKTEMKSVQNVEFPQANDELAKTIGNFKDLEALKENIKEDILHEKKHEESHRLRDEIIDRIREEADFKVPEFLTEQEQKRMLGEFKNNAIQNLKISFEDYLKQVQKTEEEFLDTLKVQAENRVKNYLILREIQKKENISASQEEIKEETNRLLSRYPDVKTAQKEVDPEKLKLYTEDIIKEEKTFKFLENFVK